MQKLLVAAVIGAVSGSQPCLAADWVVIEKVIGGGQLSIDRSSVRLDGESRLVWAQLEVPEDSNGWVRSISLFRHDCASSRYQKLQSTNWNSAGGSKSFNYDSPSWQYIRPDSLPEAVHEVVCGS
jgi:hypothetical protein